MVVGGYRVAVAAEYRHSRARAAACRPAGRGVILQWRPLRRRASVAMEWGGDAGSDVHYRRGDAGGFVDGFGAPAGLSELCAGSSRWRWSRRAGFRCRPGRRTDTGRGYETARGPAGPLTARHPCRWCDRRGHDALVAERSEIHCDLHRAGAGGVSDDGSGHDRDAVFPDADADLPLRGHSGVVYLRAVDSPPPAAPLRR